eukprot:4783025-Pleurochrysis_carterae.AAC.1
MVRCAALRVRTGCACPRGVVLARVESRAMRIPTISWASRRGQSRCYHARVCLLQARRERCGRPGRAGQRMRLPRPSQARSARP